MRSTNRRLEINLKSGVKDFIGERIALNAARYLDIAIEEIRSSKSWVLDFAVTDQEYELVRQALTDPIVETGEPCGFVFDWVLIIGFKPGVTDNEAHSLMTAAQAIMLRPLDEAAAAHTRRHYYCSGPGLTREAVDRIGRELLANPLIHTVETFSHEEWLDLDCANMPPVTSPMTTILIESVNLELADEELLSLSRRRVLALSLEELKAIREYYRRPSMSEARRQLGLPPCPTDAELEMLAQTWSEHCKHKIFAATIVYHETGQPPAVIDSLFETYLAAPARKLQRQQPEWLLSLFDDNAGVVAFDENWSLAYKIETHNSPSALDPYGGAMTGIVGVNRDILGAGKGAKPIANIWGYCLGDPDEPGRPLPGLLSPRRVREGVHAGVIDGGNQSGIPYVRGFELFHSCYRGKPLVFVGTLGILPAAIDGRPGHCKSVVPGDRVVMIGGRIGKDGIHGATFSSEVLHRGSPTQAVQIGDPITQKMMTDFLMEARDLGLYRTLTDNGAGGLASSVGELARLSGGARIDLARAPLKDPGLQPWEILLSESQERMTAAVPPETLTAFINLAHERLVLAADLGEFNRSGFFQADFEERAVVCLPLDFLHEGLPRLELQARWQAPGPVRTTLPTGEGSSELLKFLARCQLRSRELLCRCYDHEVQGRSIIKPFVGRHADIPAEAAVIRIDRRRRQAAVLSEALNPFLSPIDPYVMAQWVVDLAARRIVAAGGSFDGIAGVDNFCWPDPVQSASNPDGDYKLGQLVRACRGLAEACEAFGIPCISGKDSMKNDAVVGNLKISVYPTLLFSTLGKIHDYRQALTPAARQPGDCIAVVGTTQGCLAATEYMRSFSTAPFAHRLATPATNCAVACCRAVARATARGLLVSAHAIGMGGLAVGMTWLALGGDLGGEIELDRLPQEAGSNARELFYCESGGRFLVSFPSEMGDAIAELWHEIPWAVVGNVRSDQRVLVTHRGMPFIAASVAALRAAWHGGEP